MLPVSDNENDWFWKTALVTSLAPFNCCYIEINIAMSNDEVGVQESFLKQQKNNFTKTRMSRA